MQNCFMISLNNQLLTESLMFYLNWYVQYSWPKFYYKHWHRRKHICNHPCNSWSYTSCTSHWKYASKSFNYISPEKKKITYITFRRNGSFTEKIVKIMNHLMWASVWQRFLQSTTIRLEEWKIKRTDTENWMHHRHLPPDLRQIVRKYDLYKWLSNKGVDEESLIKHLPVDLQRKVKHHLCFDLLRRVSLPFWFYQCVYAH